MKVVVAAKCGFCHGVRDAINMAEKVLAREREKDVYSLGPIIHNRDEVERLANAGLRTVDRVEEIESGTVIIRSHGAAPEQITKLKEKGLNIVDATCGLVKRLQRIARQLEQDGYKVVIVGDEHHPEMQAVVDCGKQIVVIANESYQDLAAACIILEAAGGKICKMDESDFFLNEYLDGQKINDHLLVMAPDIYSQVRNCLQEIS